jgi:hypothetical protein
MSESPEIDEAALRARLAELQHLESGLTNKEALRTLQYEIAEVRWQLGEISDQEFEEAEEFLTFNFDF